MVPGHGGVKVMSVSVHGVGIYTAVPGAAIFSRAFNDSPDILVVGALGVEPSPKVCSSHQARVQRQNPNDSTESKPCYIGAHKVHKSTKILNEVGDARVIFQENPVVPMLVVHGGGSYRPPAPQLLQSTRINPNKVLKRVWKPAQKMQCAHDNIRREAPCG